MQHSLESGFNSANGTPGQNNRLFGRDAVVGLTSADLGKPEFGRQFNIGTQHMLSIFGANFGNGFTQWNTGAGLPERSGFWPLRQHGALAKHRPWAG